VVQWMNHQYRPPDRTEDDASGLVEYTVLRGKRFPKVLHRTSVIGSRPMVRDQAAKLIGDSRRAPAIG
jgi:hypothetical protein